MDIEKDSNREAFEAYMAEKYKSLIDRRKCFNNGGGYMAWDMNVAWQVWQAAKAQANKQFENFIDQAIEDSACADERRSLQALLDEFQDLAHDRSTGASQ